jgi:nucleoside 2-deoxyribosyltransferase
MPKAYIAAPFTSRMANKKHGIYGELSDSDYKKFLLDIESIVKSEGFSTVLPHRDISFWGKPPNLDLGECNKKYFDEINSSDIFIAYPEMSRGVHIELGWAIAHKKRIVLLVKEGFDLGTVIPGLKAVAKMDIISFKDMRELEIKLKKYLHKVKL